MCVCRYVLYIYVPVCVCARTVHDQMCVYVGMYCTSMYLYVFVHVLYMRMYMCAWYTCTCMHVCVCMCTHLFVCMHVCTFVGMCVHVLIQGGMSWSYSLLTHQTWLAERLQFVSADAILTSLCDAVSHTPGVRFDQT